MNVYADNAATTPLCDAALEAMLPYWQQHFGNPGSSHAAGRRARQALQSARERVAACIGGAADEIYFTSGGSEANNQAVFSAAAQGMREGKTHILATAFEHPAVLRTLEALAGRGFEIELLDVHDYGNISAQQVADALRPDTCLVTAMYANNEIGSILPVAEIGAVCQKAGVPFHTDAVQAAGHLPVHVHRQGISLLALSAHKFGGPKGVGALYARRGVPLTSLIYGGKQEQGRRAGTENIPAIVGMAAALEWATAHQTEHTQKVTQLRNRLIDGLAEIPGAALNGTREGRLAGNVSFCFAGVEGESLLQLLDMQGICASSGSACATGSHAPSHVLLAIGRPPALAKGSLRLTLGAENSMAEVEYMLQTIPQAVAYLRNAKGETL